MAKNFGKKSESKKRPTWLERTITIGGIDDKIKIEKDAQKLRELRRARKILRDVERLAEKNRQKPPGRGGGRGSRRGSAKADIIVAEGAAVLIATAGYDYYVSECAKLAEERVSALGVCKILQILDGQNILPNKTYFSIEVDDQLYYVNARESSEGCFFTITHTEDQTWWFGLDFRGGLWGTVPVEVVDAKIGKCPAVNRERIAGCTRLGLNQ